MTSVPSIKLAPASRKSLLSRKQVAALLGVSVACLEKWAEVGKGPKFYRKGYFDNSHTAYRLEDVEEFVRDRYGDDALASIGTSSLIATEIRS
jgi:hypothetical protein